MVTITFDKTPGEMTATERERFADFLHILAGEIEKGEHKTTTRLIYGLNTKSLQQQYGLSD